jgi:hypothetical protein
VTPSRVGPTVPPKKPSPPPLDAAKNLRQTIANFDAIVAWAINASSGIGYFATVYKRATIAMSKAIDTPGGFQHPKVMTRLTMTFSQRYFDALNAHFPPGRLRRANPRVAVGVRRPQVRRAILASQVQGVFDALAEVSPRTQTIRDLLPGDEVQEINALLIVFRDLAWKFANVLADSPDQFREFVDLQDSGVCLLSICYLYPPGKIRGVVEWIADKESRDVAENVRTLDMAAAIPSELNRAFLA